MKKSHGPMGLQRNSVKDSQKDEEEEERRREEGKEERRQRGATAHCEEPQGGECEAVAYHGHGSYLSLPPAARETPSDFI